MEKPFLVKRSFPNEDHSLVPFGEIPSSLSAVGERHSNQIGVRVDYQNGDQFQGSIAGGVRNGPGSYLIKANSCCYQGEFVNGQREGLGVLYDKNGIKRYDGYWKNNKGHGYGQMFSAKGALIYKGDFQDGKRHGFGKCY
jgi:antitoxin component YwqK of YwqJK toxin-antitoxin module